MSPASQPSTGTIRLNIVDGRREDISHDLDLLVRVLDGRHQPVVTQFVNGPVIPIMGLPFHDNADDLYTIVVHADSFQDAGVFPVRLRLAHLVDAHVMLLPKDGNFHFPKIETIAADKRLFQLVANGAAGDVPTRYHNAVENKPMELGALLTIGAAVRDIPLDDLSSPLDYYWETIWDLNAQDRFFAWVDARLPDRIDKLAKLHTFAPEPDPEVFHKGIPGRVQPATRSWKQTRFDVSNVQLTFHEGNTRTVKFADGGSVDCVIVEPDIDYFKDTISHGLLEVVPNLLSGGKTDPRQVYSLRWMATKLEGIQPDFDPLVTIE